VNRTISADRKKLQRKKVRQRNAAGTQWQGHYKTKDKERFFSEGPTLSENDSARSCRS